MKVVWGKKAKDDLKNIYDYISTDSPRNAEKAVKTILTKGESLSTMPFRYPIEPNINQKHTRFFPIWRFKFVYRVYNEKVFIKRIFHTAQNPSRLK